MKFFLDNNLGKQLADGMKGFGEEVMHLTESLSENTADIELMEYLDENNLILITRDEKIRWRPAEKEAFKSRKIGVFFLGGKNRKRCELIQQLVRNWPEIKRHAQNTDRPFIFRVRPNGTKIDRIL